MLTGITACTPPGHRYRRAVASCGDQWARRYHSLQKEAEGKASRSWTDRGETAPTPDHLPLPLLRFYTRGPAGGGRQRGRGKGFRGKGGRKGRRGGKAASALQMEVGFKALEAEYVIDWLEELQVALAECR